MSTKCLATFQPRFFFSKRSYDIIFGTYLTIFKTLVLDNFQAYLYTNKNLRLFHKSHLVVHYKTPIFILVLRTWTGIWYTLHLLLLLGNITASVILEYRSCCAIPWPWKCLRKHTAEFQGCFQQKSSIVINIKVRLKSLNINTSPLLLVMVMICIMYGVPHAYDYN